MGILKTTLMWSVSHVRPSRFDNPVGQHLLTWRFGLPSELARLNAATLLHYRHKKRKKERKKLGLEFL